MSAREGGSMSMMRVKLSPQRQTQASPHSPQSPSPAKSSQPSQSQMVSLGDAQLRVRVPDDLTSA
ncbi:hypothetical protein K402DRAFT_388252 [Aulographum hederae CBS 113979]|uniref:Uncharacterized protein n=1 Tax=Aulographum hederae CBS 113979 TaxID=1176131 RepID=A0A6G1HHP5_9PEZI|nr:hypothetical protein K402DRAFT_388252 [Aulographum hederae CBS 113979]